MKRYRSDLEGCWSWGYKDRGGRAEGEEVVEHANGVFDDCLVMKERKKAVFWSLEEPDYTVERSLAGCPEPRNPCKILRCVLSPKKRV
jgi:hypothetical protein